MSSVAKYGSKATKPKHEFSSTQVNLPPEVARKVLAEGQKIKASDLAEDGRESSPHITVKYGLHANTPGSVRDVIEKHKRITATFGKVSVFEDDGERGSDVVKIDIESADLKRLNKAISDAVKHTDTYNSYHPHVTLAYVKPGRGQSYAGDSPLTGTKVEFNSVVFSDQNRKHTEIRLASKGITRYGR